MTYEQILKKVSDELQLPLGVVKKAYESYWLFIRENIKVLPLKEDLSEEEFKELRTNFNVPSLGKLTCTYERMLGVRKRFKYIKKLKDADNKED